MNGHYLHKFDLSLCEYALSVIRGHMDRPAFAEYVEEQLSAPVLAYLQDLGGDDEPQRLLLSDNDLEDLEMIFAGGPLEFDRPWVAYEPLYRRHIDCVAEIRAVLAAEYAEEWARKSAAFTQQLESDGTRLSSGIEVVHEWVREARRLLQAMGATELLPHPEGSFPTPSCPKPPLPAHPTDVPVSADKMMAESLEIQREVRDLLLQHRT